MLPLVIIAACALLSVVAVIARMRQSTRRLDYWSTRVAPVQQGAIRFVAQLSPDAVALQTVHGRRR